MLYRQHDTVDSESVCPLCGGDWPIQKSIELIDDVLLKGPRGILQLGPVGAKLVSALVRAHRPLGISDLIYQVYDLDEPEHAEKCIIVTICKLKSKLRPIGVDITNLSGGPGRNALYCMTTFNG